MQRNESSKSNKRVVVIAIALILIFVLAFGGYTFAKYLSEKQVTANATVAKWGLTINVDSTNVFGSNYTVSDGAMATVVAEGGVAVKAASEVVAPGTTGSLTFSVTGTADVMAAIRIEAGAIEEVLLDATAGAEITYSPIKYKVAYGTSAEAVSESGYGTYNTLTEAIEAINGKKYVVAAGTTAEHYFKITWEWAFDNPTTVAGSVTGNDCDTVLGILAQSGITESVTHNGQEYTIDTENTKTNFVIDFTVVVEQILQAA